jgi:hypothetical protein
MQEAPDRATGRGLRLAQGSSGYHHGRTGGYRERKRPVRPTNHSATSQGPTTPGLDPRVTSTDTGQSTTGREQGSPRTVTTGVPGDR